MDGGDQVISPESKRALFATNSLDAMEFFWRDGMISDAEISAWLRERLTGRGMYRRVPAGLERWNPSRQAWESWCPPWWTGDI